ncbi:hypothetical protein L210DRAFT_938561, partial [Boletus edulis BED1]
MVRLPLASSTSTRLNVRTSRVFAGVSTLSAGERGTRGELGRDGLRVHLQTRD